ncbi:hypothetical protein OZ666_16900 [Elizabethkingia sp. HX QKY]|uniref:hypothetical protein n=1 Tax=Elizabethkingia TaxID=308865 RepID=UPI002A23F562|nr:hypothetical protein [Elizabethkingia sp. HX QKY]MDX8573374.1 hypothetical protein [Elizabethkingia sp. HX QKY]
MKSSSRSFISIDYNHENPGRSGGTLSSIMEEKIIQMKNQKLQPEPKGFRFG